MNCYEFEQNISAFIEDEIKKEQREKFIDHKAKCLACSQKKDEVSKIINSLISLNAVKTSMEFESVLKSKISAIQNRKHGLWYKFINFKPFGFQPIPAMGLSIALIMILGSSYLLINQDEVPEINFNNFISNKNTPEYTPSFSAPITKNPEIADKDTLINLKRNKAKNSIRLVGGK
tara:strand:- start:2019 stop:2546 length:528 start_codon:yes stop_codon:yes gene_type:complete